MLGIGIRRSHCTQEGRGAVSSAAAAPVARLGVATAHEEMNEKNWMQQGGKEHKYVMRIALVMCF